MKNKAWVVLILSLILTAVACSTSQPATQPPQEAVPTTDAARPTVIVVVTDTPVPSPTAVTGLKGTVIYDDELNILAVNPNTGESSVLLSREELQSVLAKDRSAESYTYEAERPIAISLSPDRSQALVTICADLDARYRCLFADYVYDLETKTGVQLPVPPDAYGVYWQWSPDGSKLAGSAWTYDRAVYMPTAYYAVNSDGTNLTPLGPVANDRWQIAWNSASGAIHPLGFVVNFQFLFTDRSKPQDIAIPGPNGNDSIECLAFSPDGSRVAFSVRGSVRKDREAVYIADSNFSNITRLTEYDIDSRYFCNVIWSPDGKFIHMRYEYDTRVETGEEVSGPEPRRDRLINVEAGALVERMPQGLLVCGWMPDNNLVYETKTAFGGIQIFTPVTNTPIEVPEPLRSKVFHCPVAWVADE